MIQHKAPFKFLDSYERDDIDVFFGRKEETQALYEALSGVKHLLVYGPSGAGKTSLIECGLRNQFSNADWFALPIRRGNNMTASIFAQIRKALRKPFEVNPKTQLPSDSNLSIGAAIEQLFDEKYKPVYLLFDQFEELLISGSDDEKKDFFTHLHELIRYKVPCRVLLIMREEFIGHLSEFEPLCPSIFQHRFRLEKMRRSAVQDVILNILNAPRYQPFFNVNDSGLLAANILKKLPDKKKEIELAHVQVFLSELWDRANEDNNGNNKPILHQGLIKENDNLTTVLDSFLKKQLTELESDHGDKAPLELLAAMISGKHTKLQLSKKELQEKLDNELVELKRPLLDLLNELKERRIIRQIKSDRETQYEISHDVLALVVGHNLTEEMKMRERAAEAYRVYEGKEGVLSKEDIGHIQSFKNYKNIPLLLENRIEKSEVHWERQREINVFEANKRAEEEAQLRAEAEKEKGKALMAKEEAERQKLIAQKNEKKAKERTRFAAVIMVLALILAGVSYYLSVIASESQTNEEYARIKAENAEIDLKKKNEQLEGKKDSLENTLNELDDKNKLLLSTKDSLINTTIAAEQNLKLALDSKKQLEDKNIELDESLNRLKLKNREADSLHMVAISQKDTVKASLDALNNEYKEKALGYISLARQAIYRLGYEDAFINYQQAVIVNVQTEEASRILQELAFFYNETGQYERVVEMLEIEMPGENQLFSEYLREIIKALNPAYFQILETRYYPELINISGGIFLKGCDPSRDGACKGDSELATVNTFKMAKTEVTNWQYFLFMAANNLNNKIPPINLQGDHPVANVSLIDAVEYCNWLSQKKGLTPVYEISIDKRGWKDRFKEYKIDIIESSNGFRLPSDAEWEFCARGGKYFNLFAFAGGNDLEEVGWFEKNTKNKPNKVASKKPNKLGLHDLSGNIWEWVAEFYNGIDSEDKNRNQVLHSIARGGGYSSPLSECKIVEARGLNINNKYEDMGFRICQ